ncbi:MAG TPA: hypothetical protein VGJ39_15555 [Vicinamibacterales bacterium]|jgi:hypothetical protein|nr:hypothetical protein [Vicinamibacterales bacterium]
MTSWTFRQYVTNWDEWPFRNWYNLQDPHVRNAFDFTRRILERTDDWLRPRVHEFRQFTKWHVPLGEIRFRADDLDSHGRTMTPRRIRVFGLLKPEMREFIVYGAGEEERNGRYVPADAADKALGRYRDHTHGKGEAHALD